MYRRICAAIVLLGILSPSPFATFADAPTRTRERPAPRNVAPSAEVFFSPKGGCTEAVIERLNNAKISIDVQAYSFTSAPIAKAVNDAHKRGVKVRVILDKSQRTAKYTSATYLANAGVPTWIDDKHAIAHNKIMLIDRTTIITGSFNFTKAAEQSNAENLLILTNYSQLMSEYLANFEEHLAHAKPYERDETKSEGDTDAG